MSIQSCSHYITGPLHLIQYRPSSRIDMTAYHWTSEANADKIILEGLKPGSWICRYPDDWYGEVCLRLDISYNWNDSKRLEKSEWQRRVWDGLPPEKISRRSRMTCAVCSSTNVLCLFFDTWSCRHCGCVIRVCDSDKLILCSGWNMDIYSNWQQNI